MGAMKDLTLDATNEKGCLNFLHVNMFSSLDTKLFDSKDDALAWLAE
jgi:hypothetical protein